MKKPILLTLPLLLLTVLCFGQKAKQKQKSNGEETIFSTSPTNPSNIYWRKPTSDSTAIYMLNPTPIWKPLKYVFMGVPEEVMSISLPDSTKTITVKFNRKLVHFINDSTFTFKQQ